MELSNFAKNKFCNLILKHGGILELMNFIKTTKNKISFNYSFLTLVNLFCDSDFSLVQTQIPHLINFAIELEGNHMAFSAAIHVLAVLTDYVFVGENSSKTIRIINDSGCLNKMADFLK